MLLLVSKGTEPCVAPCFQWCGCVSAIRSTLADTIRHLHDLGETSLQFKQRETRFGINDIPGGSYQGSLRGWIVTRC